MQIMDTLPNLVFLQEYNDKQIKQKEKKKKNGQKSKVLTLVEECCDISNNSKIRNTKSVMTAMRQPRHVTPQNPGVQLIHHQPAEILP